MPVVLFPLQGVMGNPGLALPLGIPAIVEGVILGSTPTRLFISGVTRDSTGAVLGSCSVTLYRTSDNAVMEQTTSDASTGAFAFSAVGLSETYYVVAYKAGGGDVAGTTVNTLVGV